MKTVAVVVTFNPDRELPQRIKAIRREFPKVIIVDNGSNDQRMLKRLKAIQGVQLILLGTNTGIAHAQNVGMHKAFSTGADAVVLFDHDSIPSKGFRDVLVRAAHDGCIVGPRIFDPNIDAYSKHPCYGSFFFRRRFAPEKGVLPDVIMVIASGCLITRSVFERVGLMREELFIDYVDWEYCLRARLLGVNCLVAGEAVLIHTRGNRELKKIGPCRFFPLGYPSWRYEKIFQNRIMVLKRYGLKLPIFLQMAILSLMYDFFVMLMENNRFKNLLSALRGVRNGIIHSISD